MVSGKWGTVDVFCSFLVIKEQTQQYNNPGTDNTIQVTVSRKQKETVFRYMLLANVI